MSSVPRHPSEAWGNMMPHPLLAGKRSNWLQGYGWSEENVYMEIGKTTIMAPEFQKLYQYHQETMVITELSQATPGPRAYLLGKKNSRF